MVGERLDEECLLGALCLLGKLKSKRAAIDIG
jgi:hypothetical protein